MENPPSARLNLDWIGGGKFRAGARKSCGYQLVARRPGGGIGTLPMVCLACCDPLTQGQGRRGKTSGLRSEFDAEAAEAMTLPRGGCWPQPGPCGQIGSSWNHGQNPSYPLLLSSSFIAGLSFDGRGFRRPQSAATKLVTRHKSLVTSSPRPALPARQTGFRFRGVITLDKKRAAGAVLLELLAERHRLREALEVLDRQHGKSLNSAWEKLADRGNEDLALYDAWLEYQGLSASLRAVESEIAGIRHGDFSFA